MASTLRELRRFHSEGLTSEEVTTFKTTLTGSYKVALSTTGGLANELLNAIQRGNDVEWIDEYPRVIQSLSLEEVNAAGKKFLDPNRMVLVQAGTLSSVEKK
jgi:zinc protease